MNRWVGVGVVVALLLVGLAGYLRPDLFPGQLDTPRLIYLLMTLLLVTGAAFGFRHLKVDGRQALRNIAAWLGLIAVIGLAYVWLN
ncbi:MAG: hypothetical protein NW206_18750 [Hyphomonadaceae bacterium]|nr:hypothetical protein [Hyphomonadaceae bacterium]